jgi:phage protein D
MGYRETGLVRMGLFVVNELEVSVDPAWEMRVHGESVDMLSSVRTTRSLAWSEVTLGEIVETIAARNGWTPAINAELAGRFYEHINQMNRSDMYFPFRRTLLGRRAEDCG